MSRSFQPIAETLPVEDWTTNNRFFHRPSKQYFVMTRRDGRFYQRRYQLDAGGREVNSLELEIQFAIGSGKHERDYIHRSESGEFLQLPVVWYAAEKAWGMAPGYDRPDHEGFTRRVSYRCVFCHASYPEVAGADRSESALARYPQHMPSGIGCERCHGPGARHAAEGSAASIVNPARLGRKLQMDACMQCHLETTSAALPNSVLQLGRGAFSYKPGEPLEDYAAYFDYPSGSDQFNIVHQAYRLRKSACFEKSEMTCLTCHDPHNPTVDYTAKCASCHKTDSIKHGGDCVSCHMVKRRTDDVVHVVMTDHLIQKRPPKDPLRVKPEPNHEPYRGELKFYLPNREPDLYMGLALLRGTNITRGIQLLERTANKSAEILFELGNGYWKTGRTARAIDNYTRGLVRDPENAEVRVNLALALMAEGKLDAAAITLREAIGQKPQLADAYVALGTIEVRRGDLNSAGAQFQLALRFDPLNTLALDNLGLLSLQLGKPADAVNYFQRVLRINPNDTTALKGLKQ